jgi:predicted P-loop ATPase
MMGDPEKSAPVDPLAASKAEQKKLQEEAKAAAPNVVPMKDRAKALVAQSEKVRAEYSKPENVVAIAVSQITADLKLKDNQSKEEEKATGPDLSLEGRVPSNEKFARTIAALRKLNIDFKYDLFRRRYRVGGYDLEERIGESVDNKILVLRSSVMYRFGFDPGDFTQPAVFRLCLQNAFNPVLDYLDSLKWDRKPRLDGWLTTYLGAEDDKLNRAFGSKTLIAGVRRVRKPGCKFDNALMLEGEQGVGKSRTVQILAGEWYRDEEIISKGNREVQELTCSVWLYEMSELVGLNKRDVEHVKNFTSRTHDSARGVWGRVLADQPRTCVFIGTCNRSDYLTDDTGNRRFWPVPVGKIDLRALERDRDQLWAEASERERLGEAITLEPEFWDDAATLAASRLADDPWDQILAPVERMPITVQGKFSREFGEMRAASDWLLRDILDLNPTSVSGASSKRLAACMRRLGWKGPKNVKINGQPDAKGYTRSLQALYDWR